MTYNPNKEKEEYINAHRHDWTMRQEADYWLQRIDSLLAEQKEQCNCSLSEMSHDKECKSNI